MPLVFKKSFRDRVDNITVLVDDKTSSSPNYFRVSDVPQTLTKGKNLIKISGHPTNLKEDTQIFIDVRDSNGNPIYYEIPDYIEDDKSRVISIWVYHDKGDDNTPNGEATITLVGIANNDVDGLPVPASYKNKLNVRWQTKVNVDRDRSSTTPIIFNSTGITPSLILSESIESYQNQPQSGNDLDLTVQEGKVRYIFKGKTPIVQITDSSLFNSEMNNQSIILSNFTTPATPKSKEEPTNLNFFSGSIKRVTNTTTIQLDNPYTASFQNREGLKHTYDSVEESDYKIEYFRTSSNVSTENQRSFVNISFNNVDPIVGVVDKVKVLQKSDGLPGEFELLNEVTVPFSSSFSVKIPMPSENLQDPKLLKIQYLNSIGEISRTETNVGPFVFQGGNSYIGGSQNLISGSIFVSNTVGTGIELGGASSGFMRSVGFEGQTSASLGKAPGGFVIYSGSGNLQMGADTLEGVGMQFIGDDDERHLIFTTANGGLLDVKTDKFFIGTQNSQFISGSDSNIEISSSLFHLDPKNNLLTIGADAVIKAGLSADRIFTPAIIDGAPSNINNASSSITQDGFAKFTSASIAGFTVNESEIKSADESLRLKADGNITASKVLLQGGTITDNVTILGSVSANSIQTPATIGGNPSTLGNASSSITDQGFASFKSASIGGWDITPNTIQGSNLVMRPEGILQTRDFASGTKGWKISSEGNGTAEFENIRIRGTLRTTTFEKESVNAVGGQLWVTNATTLTGSNITSTQTTMSVKNASGFAVGEILLAKKVDGTGFQTEYLLIESASIDGDNSGAEEVHGRIYVQRGYGSGQQGEFVGDLASSAQTYDEGQVIVSTGLSGSGYIKMNANPKDTATPYMDIVERTGSGLFDAKLKVRLGDLSGLANSDYVFGNPNPGFGLATDNVFLQGGIIANTGSIAGIKMTDGKLFTGNGSYGNSNTGFYVDSDSQFSLGNKLVWNPTTEALVIRGQLQLSDGSDVGSALAEATSSNTSKTVSLGASNYVITFNSLGNQDPAGQSITLTATEQNHAGTVYYEFYKGASLQGSRGTTNTFVADQSSEQPSATTPVTYEVKTFEVASGGSQIASDTLTLFGVQAGASGSDGSAGSDGTDGQDAVTAFLTNEAHTFAANPDKSIVSFTGGSTDMIVFEGVTDKTTSYSYSRSSSTSVSSSIDANTVTVTSMAHDSGSIIITATSASTSLSKTMSLSKAIAGQTGSDGSDGNDGAAGLDGSSAKTLVASIDSQVMAFDDSTDTSATPTEVVFSFNQQNLNAAIGSSDITISTAGGNVTNFGFDNNSVTNSSGKHSGISSGSISFTGALSSGGLNSTKTNLPVTVSVSKDGLADSIKVFKVEGGSDGAAGSDGTDAVTTFLTNESHTFTAESDGTIISFIGGSTDMEVFEGVTNSTANYTISSSRGLGVTATDSGKTVTISGMTHDSGSVTITATSASVSLSKSMSLTKSKQGTAGLAGSDAKILTVSSDSQVFSFPSASSSTAIDDDILITINQQNLSGTVGSGDFTIVDANGSTLSDPTLSASVTDGSGQVSGSITFSGTVSGDKTKLPLTITVSKDSLEDSIKIFGIDGGNEGQDGAAGADAVTTFLTNESHTFPADSSGSIASFVGGSTDMEIFEGITNKTSLYTISSSVSLGVTATDNSNTVTISGMNHDSGSVTITATSASVSLSKIMSLTKARQGSDGSDGTSAKLLIGSLDSQVFAFTDSTDTTSEPEKVFFSFQQQNLSATIVAGDLTITTAGGSNITNFDFNNADVSNGTGIVSGSIVFSQALNNGGVAATKSNLPITVSATKDGLQDSVRVFKVEGGSDGTDGESARTMILTNESHTFAAQPNGTIISFTGGDTDVEVFTGTSNTTSDYSISAASTTSVSSSVSSNTVTVTSMGHDSGSVVVTATSASVNLQKLFSLTKAKQGADGEDGLSGDKFADTSITTTINLSTLSINDTVTFTADTGLAWTTGLTAVVAYDGSNSITGTVNSYNSSNGSMSINVDSIVGTSTQTAWTLNLGGTAGPQGVSGVSAKSLVASTDSQVFSFLSASDSTAEPTSIIFSFNQQNLNDSIGSSDVTITAGDGTNITGFGFDNNSVTDGTGIASGSISFSGGTSAGGLNSDKTKLPVTISVTNDSLTDSIKVFKVEGGTSGTDGTDGSDAVTTFLTNEAHTFASQNDGTIVSFSGAQTDMEVFEGVTNKTSVYTFSKSDGLGVTSSITGKTVTVSGMTHDSGSVTITAASASTSLSKTMSLVKSKQGTAGLAGADAKLLTITSDSQVFAFPSASSSTPEDNDILLIINQQNLSGTIGDTDVTIKDVSGNTLTDPTFVSSVTDGTGQVSGSITFSGTVGGVKTKLPLTIEVTKDGLEDSLKIFKVEGGTSGTDGTDGSDAVTAFLTNESHTFPADSTGAIASFVGGSTEMEVFEGVTNKTSLYTISSSRGLGVVATDSGNTVTVSALGHDSGSLTITATSASVSLSKTMSLTKARQGADGDDGTSAKLLAGSLESQVFSFLSASDNTSDPSEIIFTFNQQNLNGTIGSGDITISTAGGNVTNFDFDNNDVSNGTGVVSGSITFAGALNSGGLNSTKSNLPVTITATKDGLSDAVKIFKVEGGTSGTDGTPGTDGVSAVTAFLTNDSHTLPLSSSNTIISLTGASTEIEVFEGTSNKTSLYTVSQTTPSHFTTTLSGNELTITSGSFPHTGSIVLTATSASVSLAKTMSISVARQGDDGTDGNDGAPGVNGTSAKILTITSDSQVFGFDNSVDTTATPSSIVFTIAQQNLAHTIDTGDITITKAGSSTLTTPSLSGTVNSGTGQQTFTVPFSSLTKSDLPLTVAVSNNANNLSDSIKIFKVAGGDTGSDGAAGAAGSDAVTTFLTNEAHTFASQNDGTIVSFVGATTDMEVFEGVTNATDDYTFTRTNGTGVSSTISTNTVTITAMSHDSGSVDITATSGSTSLSKTMSLVKSKQGTAGLAGADAKSVSLVADSQTFAFDNSVDTTATPSSVNFTVNQQNLSGTIATSDITITKAGGSAFTTPSLGGSVSNGTGTRTFALPFSSFSKSDLPLSIAVSKDSLSDSAKIFKIVGGDTGSDGSAGTDAVTAFLTNESHTFAADFSGSIASFVGGSTDMEVFEGVTNKTSEYTFTRTSTTSVSSSISSNTVTITSMGHDSGSVVVTATKGATSLSKTMSVVKSRQGGVGAQGAVGAAGTNAKVVSLLANKSVITYNGSDVETPSSQTITLTATDQNHSGTVYYEFLKDGSSQQNSTTATFTINTTAEKPTSTGNVSYVVKTREGGTSGTVIAEDSVSIFGVKSGLDGTAGTDGTSAITAFLTSDGDIVPAASDGTVSSFVGSGTEMIIFQGADDVSTDYTVTRTNSTGLSSTLSTRVLTITALTPDSGSVILTATSASGEVGQVQISKTYSIGKSKQGDTGDTGAAGSNAKTVTLTAASNIFVKAQTGTVTPSSIVITANGQNLTQAGTFSTTAGTLTSTSTTTSGGSTTVTSGNFVDGMVVTYTAHSNDGSISDSVTLKELDEGSGNITAILENEAHVLPANASGVVSSYSNSGTKISVFEGATALDYDGSGTTDGHWTVSTSQSPSSTITIGSISDSTNDAVVGNHSSMANGTDSVTITYAISGKTLNGTAFSFNKTQTLGKAKTGATGPQGDNNQDFSFLGASLTGIGPISSAGLLMTSNVFGFHNGISGTDGALTDFTSFLDSSGNFYLGGNASGASNPTDGYFAWNNTDKSLLISGSKATIAVDKFFVGTKTTQFISGSNGNIEISSSKFHIKPDGDVIVRKVTADEGTIGGFELTDTQINSSNDNLILKASGQVTASTLLLTGGTVAGMPVSSDEIAVGEVLKLKQSGQITGSSVLFSGGNIGGFQLEDSSLYQTPTALPLLSASFQLKQSFGDYGNVPPFEYKIKFGSQNFYIDDLETNCPPEYLSELIKSGSILSSSNFSTLSQGLFQYGNSYYNETKFVVVETFDPKSGFMKLGHDYRLSYYSAFGGGPGTTRVHVVQGVGFNAQYTDGTNDGSVSENSSYTTFTKANETKNLTLSDKITTKLILSSSAEIKSEIGKIGSFTITGSNVVVTDNTLDRSPIYDFRVYVEDSTLPSAALNDSTADENNGTPLQLYINGEFWDIANITNVGSNGYTNEGYGYYLAISSSARSSSNLVYDQSQLDGLGMFTGSAAAQSGQSIDGWPRGGSGGGSTSLLDDRGFSYIPRTENTLGQNENWYLKYFDTTTLQSGDTDDFINARVTFLSESINNTFNKFTVFAQTASIVGNYQRYHEGALSLQLLQTGFSKPVGDELPNDGFYAQALLIDGGGGKLPQIATTSSLANSYHTSQFIGFTSNESKANFYESQTVQRDLPVATQDLITKLTIDGKYIQQIINQTSASAIYSGNSSAAHWARASSDGITLSALLKDTPFLYSSKLANNGISAEVYAALQNACTSMAGDYTGTSLEESFNEAGGFQLVGSASMHFMPYYDLDSFNRESTGFQTGQDGFLPVYNTSEFKFPNFLTSEETPNSNITYTMRNPGGGKHMLVLDKGYILNPLVNLALTNLNKLLPNSPTSGYNHFDETLPGEGNNTLLTWDKYRINGNGTYNDTTDNRFGIPFEVSHTYVTGSSTRGTKMILKNAIYPENVAVRGTINSEALRSKVIEGLSKSVNDLLLEEGVEDTVTITERISDNVVQTNVSNALQALMTTDVDGELPYIEGSQEEFFIKLSFAEESKFGEGIIRMGTTSGSLRNSTVLSISSSGEISSSNYVQKPDGQVTGSKINFTGGKISGSDMSIFANEFEFKDDNNNGIIKGNKTTFEISSSLFNLKPTSLDVKGNIQAEQVYGQDTFLAGKVVNTGVRNPNSITVKYNLPFVEAYSQDSNDTRLTGSTVESGFIMSGSSTILSQTGSRIQGNHVRFSLSSNLQSTPQFLTPITADGVGYPEEFKSWKDISGVNNDYVFVSNTSARTAAEASASLSANLIGNQLVFNEATSSALLFQSSSNSFQSITTDTINLFDVLKEDRRNVHLQFAVRGTAHPSTGSFNGYNPEYQVQVLDTSGSLVVWEKTYKDTKATHKNWAVFDVPMTDIATFYKQTIEFNKSTGSFDEGNYLGNPNSSGLKVKINMRYSGSALMSQRLNEGKRFGGLNLADGSFTLGFALTEMRMVEPVRATSIDTQTVHFKDTYMTWHDNPATTGHYGNFVPEFTSSATTSSFALGAPTEKWESIYLDLKEDNQYPEKTLVGNVSQSNKFVRVNTHTGKLTFTSASAGSGGGGVSSYSLPLAASGTRGGVQIGYTESGKNYPVELSSEKMYVNVPWTDNNTTYSVGDGGLTQKNFTTTLKTKLDGIADSANNYSFPYTVSSAAGNSTVVQRNSSGYIFSNYYNGTGTFATTGQTSGMGRFTGTNGTDTYGRSYTAAAARTLLNVADGANVGIPASGGTMSGTLNLNNNTISNVGQMSFNDPGPNEGLSWTGGNTKIYESPDNLTTNSAGNLQFVYGSTRRMSITNTGADINGVLTVSGNTTVSGDIYGKSVNNAYSNLYRFGGIYFTWDSDSYGNNFNHSITSTSNGTYGDHITLNSYGNIRMNFDSNSNGTNTFSIGHQSTGTANTLFNLDEAGKATISSLTGTGNRMVIANASGELDTQAIPSGGGGGGTSDISMDGSTANGLITYGGTDNIDVESNLTFDGTNLVTSSGPTGGRLRFGDGTYSSPTYAFAGDVDTGMWLGGAADLRFSVGATTGMKLNANGLRIDDALGVNVNASTTDGRIDAGNDIVAYSTSDERLKENVKTIDSSLSKVLQIRGVEFDWKELTEEEKKTIHGNEGHDVGVIAQEIEKVLPEVVTERENGYKAVKYEKIVPLLIEAIKEQSDTITKLTERINKLEKGSNN